ncbi:hypothetical protein LWI29_002292 [Acer saccharum]|uniref:Uncharacterized protein n=1 Tax=Acer saccharum TaxID=4024 RepID=A0AA39T025_ACESA|nr:hypothetical protein LWI29_002292 [Acer saccharum]
MGVGVNWHVANRGDEPPPVRGGPIRRESRLYEQPPFIRGGLVRREQLAGVYAQKTTRCSSACPKQDTSASFGTREVALKHR